MPNIPIPISAVNLIVQQFTIFFSSSWSR